MADKQSAADASSLSVPQAKGKNTALFLTSYVANLVLDTVRGIRNLKVFVQQTDGTNVLPAKQATVVKTPGGITISIPALIAASTGSGNQWARGAGAPGAGTLPAGSYVAGQNPSFYFDSTNIAFYYCSTAGTQATAAWTNIPIGGSGNQIQIFTIGPLAADITANTIVSTSGVGINKPPELSGSLVSEVIDGVTITYSNYSNNFNTRIATDGSGNNYTQYITPRYAVNQGGIIAALIGGQWYELSPSRQWGGTP